MSLFPLFQDFTGYSLYKSSGQATDLGAQKNPSVTWQHKGQEVPQLVYTLLTCNLVDGFFFLQNKPLFQELTLDYIIS